MEIDRLIPAYIVIALETGIRAIYGNYKHDRERFSWNEVTHPQEINVDFTIEAFHS